MNGFSMAFLHLSIITPFEARLARGYVFFFFFFFLLFILISFVYAVFLPSNHNTQETVASIAGSGRGLGDKIKR